MAGTCETGPVYFDFLVCLVHLVSPLQPDRLHRHNESDLQDDFSSLLAAGQVNQTHCEKVAACPTTICSSAVTTFQITAFSTRKRRPVDVILTPR